MVQRTKTSRLGDLSLEGINSGVVNACLNQSVPVSIDSSTSVFWELTRPTNDESDASFVHYVPFYFMQLAAVILGIHVLSLLLKPLRLPRFSVELLAAILVGQGLQSSGAYTVPLQSVKSIITLGHCAILCYVFLVGLEIDLLAVRRVGRHAVYTGITGTLLPFLVGFIQFFVMAADRSHPNFFSPDFWQNLAPVKLTGPFFWGVSLTVTSFPDLARTLSDIKLLHTDVGRLALSSSIVSELTTWFLLIVTLTLNSGTVNPLYLLPTFIYIAVSWFLVRPAVTWVLRHAEETDNKVLLNFTVFGGVLVSSIVGDACGANSMMGAFVFGLIIPADGDMSAKLVEKFEDYVKGVLVPAFFLDNGVRCSWDSLFNPIFGVPLYTILLLVVVAWSAKIVGTFVFSKLAGMENRDAFTLGVLMNTKGVLALIVINNGRNNQGFNQLMFVVLILSILSMSITVMPLAKAANKPYRRPNQFKNRTLESNKLESELRVLTCIHTTRNLSGMINLLEFSNTGKQYPVSVFALHLVQLTDRRATAMLIVHENNNSNNSSHHMFEGSGQIVSRREEEAKHIIMTFESLENRGALVSSQSLTVVSPYTTMHEDITSLGEDKRASLILLPFHKQADVYGMLQDENLNWRTVNKNLMATATCSVGILVDRGLGSKDVTTTTIQKHSLLFVVIFIGGPDDREALAYGWRMAKSPNVNLTVLRLLPSSTNDDHQHDDGTFGGDIEEVSIERVGAKMRSKRNEREVDDEYMNEFRFRTMHDESINYIEKQVKTGDEVITTIGRVVPSYDLYVLGQSKNMRSSIMSGLSEWTECEELGVLGDTLLSSEFAQQSSLLVLKQHYVPGMHMWIRRHGNNRDNDNAW